jgi:hypothetical protein
MEKTERGEIKFDDVKFIYSVWKEVYFYDKKKCDGIKEIHDNSKKPKMSKGSANDYLYDLKCFYEDKLYCRTQKPEDTLYFLSQIYKEYRDKYQNALSALKKHINYYKEKNGTSSVEKLYNYLIKGKIDIHEVSLYYENNDGYYTNDYVITGKKKVARINNNLQSEKNISRNDSSFDLKPVPLNKYSHSSNDNNILVSMPNSKNDNFLFEYYNFITINAQNVFSQIKEYRNENNKIKIFKEEDALKLWRVIGELIKYSEGFDNFIKSLHDLFLENARDKTSEGKYKSRFPDKFVERGTWTKEYIDDIKVIRNKFAHPKSRDIIVMEDNEWGKKRTFLDVCEKYLGSRHIPESVDDFQELQIGIMNHFKNVLRKLLEIVKNE